MPKLNQTLSFVVNGFLVVNVSWWEASRGPTTDALYCYLSQRSRKALWKLGVELHDKDPYITPSVDEDYVRLIEGFGTAYNGFILVPCSTRDTNTKSIWTKVTTMSFKVIYTFSQEQSNYTISNIVCRSERHTAHANLCIISTILISFYNGVVDEEGIQF